MWSQKSQYAFEKIKSLLLSMPVLKAPDFENAFKLQVDASDNGIGAFLLQKGIKASHILYVISLIRLTNIKLTILLLRKKHWLFC